MEDTAVEKDNRLAGEVGQCDIDRLTRRGDLWIGPGERSLIRMVVRDGETTVEQVAEGCELRRELVEQIAASG